MSERQARESGPREEKIGWLESELDPIKLSAEPAVRGKDSDRTGEQLCLQQAVAEAAERWLEVSDSVMAGTGVRLSWCARAGPADEAPTGRWT